MVNYRLDFEKTIIRSSRKCAPLAQKRELGGNPKRSGHCIQGVKPQGSIAPGVRRTGGNEEL